MKRGYGWIPDLPRRDDRRFKPTAAHVDDKLIDWRSMFPPCYDQGDEGSCSPNATIGAVQFLQKQQGEPVVMMSRNFLYFNVRSREGTIDSDSGSQLRDCLISLVVEGVCPESEWQYDTHGWDTQPPQRCYDAAIVLEVMDYERVDNTSRSDMLAALTRGPVIGGFSVCSSFESDEVSRSGYYNPKPDEDIVGGHAIVVVGSDPTDNTYIVRNSWGTNWGMHGYFKVPRPCFEDSDMADDFWLLREIS